MAFLRLGKNRSELFSAVLDRHDSHLGLRRSCDGLVSWTTMNTTSSRLILMRRDKQNGDNNRTRVVPRIEESSCGNKRGARRRVLQIVTEMGLREEYYWQQNKAGVQRSLMQ